MHSQVPQEIRALHAGPLEDRHPHDGRLEFGRDEDQLQREVDEQPFRRFPQSLLKLDLCSLRVKLGIGDLDLSHKDLGLLLGAFVELLLLMLEMVEVEFDDDFLGVVGADEGLQVHESVTHVLALGLEEVLDLVEGEQLGDVVRVLGSHDALPPRVLLEVVLPLLLVGHLRMVQQETLQQEVLDLEHVHLRLAAYHPRRRGLLVLGDPVLREALVEDAGLGQGQPHLPRHLLPLQQLVDEVQVGLLVVQRVVLLRLPVMVPVGDDPRVLLQHHALAELAATALVVQLMVLAGTVQDLRRGVHQFYWNKSAKYYQVENKMKSAVDD